MKVVNKHIDVIALFKKDRTMIPLKFRIVGEDDAEYSYKVNVQSTELMKHAGKEVYRYICQVTINEQVKICEIRFSKDDMIWTLFKI